MDDLNPPQWLVRADGVRLAFHYRAGKGPTLVFLPGYMSDMEGSKAIALEAWAIRESRAMLRLDYSGCGKSGGAFEDGTLDIWRDDVLLMIHHLIEGPVLLVGSSMGGWLALLITLVLKSQVVGLIGIAGAPDFTDWGFGDREKEQLQAHGRLERVSEYGPEPMVTTRAFWESGNANRLLQSEIAIDCPVRLIHGQRDSDVPWQISLDLAARLRSADVQTLLIKDGDHRLSRPPDIAALLRVVGESLEAL
ncbi:MAG: alpha/beta hydrolase [Pseudomonadota bacterium]